MSRNCAKVGQLWRAAGKNKSPVPPSRRKRRSSIKNTIVAGAGDGGVWAELVPPQVAEPAVIPSYRINLLSRQESIMSQKQICPSDVKTGN